MAKNLEISYLLDFYGEVLTEKQRDALGQYYDDDFSLSEIAENLGITRQGVRDAIKHGENSLLELERKVGFAKRYRLVEEKLAALKELVSDAKYSSRTTYAGSYTDYNKTFNEMLALLESIEQQDEGEA